MKFWVPGSGIVSPKVRYTQGNSCLIKSSKIIWNDCKKVYLERQTKKYFAMFKWSEEVFDNFWFVAYRRFCSKFFFFVMTIRKIHSISNHIVSLVVQVLNSV